MKIFTHKECGGDAVWEKITLSRSVITRIETVDSMSGYFIVHTERGEPDYEVDVKSGFYCHGCARTIPPEEVSQS